MIADTKKVQTLINIVGQNAQLIRDAVETMKATRTLFNTADPDTTGTPLAGKETAVSNLINNLDTEISAQGWTDMIDAVVSSHRNKAL